MNKITEKPKFPQEEHFAALVFESHSIHHEGDERSRTCPGHGYPAYTETIKTIDYIVFANEQEMKDWVVKTESEEPLGYREPTVYQLIRSKPLKAKIHATVELN